MIVDKRVLNEWLKMDAQAMNSTNPANVFAALVRVMLPFGNFVWKFIISLRYSEYYRGGG